MRVLVTAYSCEPNTGSESGAGWNWLREIAKRYECHVITRVNNVEAIERGARELGLENLTVHGYDLPRWARFWKRGQRGSSAYYYLWQLGLIGLAKKLDAKYDFDVVHHVTYVVNYMPSGLAFLNKPFVWGPVGQHPPIPLSLVRKSDLRLKAAELVKNTIKFACRHFDPLFKKTLRRSDLILSVNRSFEQSLSESEASKLIPFAAIGVDAQEKQLVHSSASSNFEVLYSGRLVDLKGIRLTLAAFAKFARETPEAVLRVLGTGPLKESLIAEALELGIYNQVHFEGVWPHSQALAAMRLADVFLFPSMEGAGMVVIEAMAARTPVLCLDYGGPGRMVGEDRGVRVPVGKSFEATATSLATALKQLHADAELRERISASALTWVNESMTWDSKGARLSEFYTRAIEHYESLAA